MSEHDDNEAMDRVPEYRGTTDEESRRELGRQLAMDSILVSAHGATSAAGVVHRRRWPLVVAVAAGLTLFSTVGWWLGQTPSVMQIQGEDRQASFVQETTSAPPAESRRSASPGGELVSGGNPRTEELAAEPPENKQPEGKKAYRYAEPEPSADPRMTVAPKPATKRHEAEKRAPVPQQHKWGNLSHAERTKLQTQFTKEMGRVPTGVVPEATVLHVDNLTIAPPPSSGNTLFYDGKNADDARARLEQYYEKMRVLRFRGGANTESYDSYVDNAFATAKANQLSTFSIDVDTASYTNIRDLLKRHQRPPKNAVRVEEMVNYFDYNYAQPKGEHPVAIAVDMSQAPWAPQHRLVRIGLQARKAHDDRPAANLVFLVDVSGSMTPSNKLPLLKTCLKDLCDSLRKTDRIAIVVYAGAAGLALESTPVSDKQKILASLDKLRAGGSTNGGAGIDLAYKCARDHFVDHGINRVILCTDGDFNVGVSDRASLITMIEKKRETGVFLSVLGFGRGNLRDSQMEQIADKGNGAYHYIDSAREGHRVLVDKLDASLMTIAKDVKVQVEFNPTRVASYRLIGYANRLLRKQDFNDDTKDAGEMGAGHTVTALYEVVPVGVEAKVDDLRYTKTLAKPTTEDQQEFGDELMFVKVRYKHPTATTSKKLTQPAKDDPRSYDQASPDFRFAAAVAAFGMILRDSPHKGTANFQQVLALAEDAMGEDENGYRAEFLNIVQSAQALMGDRR